MVTPAVAGFALDAVAVESNTVSAADDVEPAGLEVRPVSFELATVV
jgi:hypothetical protein